MAGRFYALLRGERKLQPVSVCDAVNKVFGIGFSAFHRDRAALFSIHDGRYELDGNTKAAVR